MAAPDLPGLIQIKSRPLIVRKLNLVEPTSFAHANKEGGCSTTKYVLVPDVVSYIILKNLTINDEALRGRFFAARCCNAMFECVGIGIEPG